MTLPLRIAAAAAGLLVSGFTAEHLASLGASDSIPPPVSTVALPAMAADSARSRPEAEPLTPVTLGTRLPMGPVQGPVSSPFGWREHPVSGRVRHHDGVDLAVPVGTAVWTVAPGTVRAVGRQRGYGLVVEIEHPTGLGQPVRTRYAHLASVDAALRPGLRVGRGVALGASGGRPGRDGVSTGAHLHFEVRDASGHALDPARFVRLPEAVSTAPRWAGPTPPAEDAGSLVPPTPDVPAPAADPVSDSLDADDDGLPELVLPDYPDLPALDQTP